MATNLRSLSVSVVARTSKFRKGMRSASKSVNRFGANVVKASAKLGAYGMASEAVAAGGLGILVKNQLSLVDAITVTSDKLGIATDKLVGLRLAAELSGQSVGVLESGLQRMTRRISEAAKDTGVARVAIKELGLSAQKLFKLSPDKQFAAIGDALEGVANQADRVRLGGLFFDIEGVGLINTLKGGSAALKLVQADAEKLGLTFSRIDGAKVQNLNVAVTRLRGLIRGAARSLAIELSPFLQTGIDKIVELGTAGGGASRTIIDGFEGVLKTLAKGIELIDQLTIGFKTVQFGLLKIEQGVVGASAILAPHLGGPQARADKIPFELMKLETDIQGLQVAGRAGTRVKSVENFFEGIRKAADAAAVKAAAEAGKRRPGGLGVRGVLGGALSGIRGFGDLLGGLGSGGGASISAGAPSGSLTELTSGFGVVSGTAKTNQKLTELIRIEEQVLEVMRNFARNASSLKFAG